MIAPPRWTEEELDAGRATAREVFRPERMQGPLEQYLERFDQYQGVVEDLLETTIDVSKLDDAALAVLTDPNLLHAFRYLAGPPNLGRRPKSYCRGGTDSEPPSQ